MTLSSSSNPSSDLTFYFPLGYFETDKCLKLINDRFDFELL
jgi:hypothetical protein